MDASGYSYGESKSVKGGKFLGLPLDQVPVKLMGRLFVMCTRAPNKEST